MPHLIKLLHNDKTKKKAHDSQIVRAKENLNLSHGEPSKRQASDTNSPMKDYKVPCLRTQHSASGEGRTSDLLIASPHYHESFRFPLMDRVKSGIFGQTAIFGQRPCLFHISNDGIKNKLTKRTVKILMRRLIRSRLMTSGFTLLANVCRNLPDVRIYPTLPYILTLSFNSFPIYKCWLMPQVGSLHFFWIFLVMCNICTYKRSS